MIGTAAELIAWLIPREEEEQLYELEPHNKKRSLNQNAYYWLLCGKVARKIGMRVTELHNMMLRDYSRPEVFGGQMARTLLPDTDETEQKVLRQERLHLKPTQQVTTLADGVTYRTYVLVKGSSDMTTDEMAYLLEGMVQEAKMQGVETLTPKELAEMRIRESGVQDKTKPRDGHKRRG